MKLPRDIGGEELSKLLTKYGYEVIRQTGSHLRLTTHSEETEHHVTIPRHSPLKLGTLHSIITAVADHLKKDRQEVIRELFSR